MSNTVHLTKETIDETIEKGVVFVDFWAPWCGPCRMISGIIDELADDFEGKAVISKVNTDEEQDIAVKYGIRSIPTVMIFKNGVVVDTMVGAQSKTVFSEKIERALQS